MAGFKFDLKGADKLKKRLENMPKRLEAVVKSELLDFVTLVNDEQVGTLRGGYGYDTGRMAGATFFSPENLSLEYVISSNVDYAAYVEFGTGGLVEVSAGLETYAAQFKGKGVKEVNLPARPFFFPPFFRNIPTLIETLDKKLSDL